MKKWFQEWRQDWSAFVDGDTINNLHLFFQLLTFYLIVTIVIFNSFVDYVVYDNWDLIMIMGMSAINGYFSNKQTAKKLTTNIIKIWNNLRFPALGD